MRILNALTTVVVLTLWSFSASATSIYTITESGDMLFYKYAGYNDGSANWPIQAKKIGNGWNFREVFASGT
ncbi:hypothetical protein IB75_06735 [Nitrosococcus oceani C-27]|uniref:Uncharacterized protein n=1 Tax=Nitrosococcus oceani C-27 TaxID=314279 RepID=A0A0E2Z843_9GAMM|nr:hypothetical protein IB75_06735 [Nitrosococcus oceani C-27]GEM21678.1 hypothetical protein NONS58_31280 [Nitrosococcus oceani]